MKRSEVNAELKWAKDLLEKNNIRLPETAYWSMADWQANRLKAETIRKVMLGWDISDYGLGTFGVLGAVLYTVRNGLMDDRKVGVPYCEKYIIMRNSQRLIDHYHVYKTEDIINRAGGGVLQVFLWNVDPKTGEKLGTDVRVFMDGIEHIFKAGEKIRIWRGESISLTPYLSHIFGPEPGTGDVIVGEVSRVNDDNTDNFFFERAERFAEIEEDEPILHPLCNEYARVLA